MNEHTQTNQLDPLLNLLFDDGLQSALPRISAILTNAAMMVVRPDQDVTGNLQDRNSTLPSPAAFTGIGLANASTHKMRME